VRVLITNWATAASILAAVVLAAAFALPAFLVVTLLEATAIMAAVLAAVHHAEVVAHRVGEPFGTLVLALAVTIIEAALIVTMMLAGGDKAAELARDSIYAAVMIICTGVVGVSLLVGGVKHREQSFRSEGAGPALAALATLSVIVLLLPDFTTSAPAPLYSTSQLVFTALASIALWAVFIFFQTVRHRDYFLPPDGTDETHALPPTAAQAWAAFVLLMISLVAVVGLAKKLSPVIEATVIRLGAPQAFIGVAIAMLVLLPETVAAVRAAAANRLQTSMNLALGSALACIGLTVPVVVAASLVLRLPLVLGVDPKDVVLLSLALLVSTITLATGRTNLMQGAVHLVLFAAFLFLTLVP
jgi:Ca2+:H+ antiporter